MPGITQQHYVITPPEFSMNFVVMGDPQPEEPPLEQTEVFLSIVKDLQSLQPDVVIIVGDLIRGFTENPEQINQMWNEYEKAVKPLHMPILVAAGNHDIWDETSKVEFIRRFGGFYSSTSFGNVHFIMLNSHIPGEENRIGPDQLRWLENDLQQHGNGKQIFIGVHAPLWAYGDHSNWMDDVHPILRQYNVRGVFGGHWHIYQRSDVIDGIKYYVTGGAGGLMGDHSIASGEFHHYMYVSVRDENINYSVIEPGSIYHESIVTKESSLMVHDIRDNVIGDPRLMLNNQGEHNGIIEVKVANPYESAISGSIEWNGSSPFYTILPVDHEYDLKAGEQKNIQFELMIADPNSIDDIFTQRPVISYNVSKLNADEIPLIQVKDDKKLITVRTVKADSFSGELTIDGILDDWDTHWPIELNHRSQVTLVPDRWQGIEEVSGRFAVKLSDTHLFFAGEVVDNYVMHSPRKNEPYQGDAVTLYLDLRGEDEFQKRMFMEHVYAVIFVPECISGDEPYIQTIYPFGTEVENIDFATKRTKNGYTIEVAIPIDQLIGFNPSSDMIGFDVCIDNLYPDGTRTRMMWNGPYTNYMYGNKYGRLILGLPL